MREEAKPLRTRVNVPHLTGQTKSFLGTFGRKNAVSWRRNGPQTPRNSSATTERVRIYTTAGAEERIFQDDISPFDPASTPSRGMRVGASVDTVFTTPKWQICGPPAYPTSPYRNGIGPDDVPSSSPYGMPPHEDTPVDRTAPRPSVLASKRMQDSPLMGRGIVVHGHPHTQDSPVPLGRKGKEPRRGEEMIGSTALFGFCLRSLLRHIYASR
jgi:hypothetical protein